MGENYFVAGFQGATIEVKRCQNRSLPPAMMKVPSGSNGYRADNNKR